jgi:hypothetical protein
LLIGILGAPKVAATQPQRATSNVVALSRQTTPDILESSFFEALRSHLKELGIGLEVSSAPRTNDPLTIASSLTLGTKNPEPIFYTWLAQYPPRVIVYLYEPGGPHLGARESTLGSSTAATSEELALILRSAILARRSGARAELDEVDWAPAASTRREETDKPSAVLEGTAAPPADVTPAASPTHSNLSSERGRSPNLGAAIGFAYEKPFSRDAFQGGLHARLWLGTDTTRVGLGYLATPTFVIRTRSAELTIERRPVDIFVSQTLTGRIARVAGELRLVVDPLRRRTLTAQSPLEPEPATTRWTYALGAFVRGEVSLTPGLSWTAWAGADVVANPFTFGVTRGDKRETISDVLTVRPALGTGLLLFAR